MTGYPEVGSTLPRRLSNGTARVKVSVWYCVGYSEVIGMVYRNPKVVGYLPEPFSG
jgi:hypothetical protein